MNVVAFPRHRTRNNALASIYKVQAALREAGYCLAMEVGCTDEGDPWASFTLEGEADVVAHLAFIDGEFVADSPAFSGPLRSRVVAPLVERLVKGFEGGRAGGRDSKLILLVAAVALAASHLANADGGPFLPLPVDSALHVAEQLASPQVAAALLSAAYPEEAHRFVNSGETGEALPSAAHPELHQHIDSSVWTPPAEAAAPPPQIVLPEPPRAEAPPLHSAPDPAATPASSPAVMSPSPVPLLAPEIEEAMEAAPPESAAGTKPDEHAALPVLHVADYAAAVSLAGNPDWMQIREINAMSYEFLIPGYSVDATFTNKGMTIHVIGVPGEAHPFFGYI